MFFGGRRRSVSPLPALDIFISSFSLAIFNFPSPHPPLSPVLQGDLCAMVGGGGGGDGETMDASKTKRKKGISTFSTTTRPQGGGTIHTSLPFSSTSLDFSGERPKIKGRVGAHPSLHLTSLPREREGETHESRISFSHQKLARSNFHPRSLSTLFLLSHCGSPSPLGFSSRSFVSDHEQKGGSGGASHSCSMYFVDPPLPSPSKLLVFLCVYGSVMSMAQPVTPPFLLIPATCSAYLNNKKKTRKSGVKPLKIAD